MTQSEIPIPAEAIEAADNAFHFSSAGPLEAMEAAIRAALLEMQFEVERDDIHEPYASFEGYGVGNVAYYRARCHRCRWTGRVRADGSRNENKSTALNEAEAHRQVGTRLVSAWQPVESQEDSRV